MAKKKGGDRRSVNGTLLVDFEQGLSARELDGEKGSERSMWVRRLKEFRADIDRGLGKRDMYYRIGQFKNETGARTAIRNLQKRNLDWLEEFSLKSRITYDEKGKRVSEMWVALMSEEARRNEAAKRQGK